MTSIKPQTFPVVPPSFIIHLNPKLCRFSYSKMTALQIVPVRGRQLGRWDCALGFPPSFTGHYFAESVSTILFETRSVLIKDGQPWIKSKAIAHGHVTWLSSVEPLVVLDLTSRLAQEYFGLRRELESTSYGTCQAFALYIHTVYPEIDGIRWPSAQLYQLSDDNHCVFIYARAIARRNVSIVASRPWLEDAAMAKLVMQWASDAAFKLN